jgi:hypothetical protein
MVRKTAVRITEDTLAVFASEIETFLFEEARFRSSEATKDIKDKAVDDKLAEKRKAARMAKISAQWLKIAVRHDRSFSFSSSFDTLSAYF